MAISPDNSMQSPETSSSNHGVTSKNAEIPAPLEGNLPASPCMERGHLHKEGFWGALQLLSRESFSGYERSLTALNAGLTRAWDQNNPISWVLARVRCEILQLTPLEYAANHRHLSLSTLSGLESARNFARANYTPDTIHLLFKGWDAIAKARKDPRITEMLGEAKSQILELLTARHGGSIYGALSRWRYEVGSRTFEKATGLNYKTLWIRNKNEMVTEFSELLAYARKLGFVKKSEKPPDLWKNPKVIEIRDAYLNDSVARGRAREVAKLHSLLHAVDLKVDGRHLGPRSPSSLQSITVHALARFSMVPWQKVSPLFSLLQKQGFLTQEESNAAKNAWKQEFKARPKSVEDELLRLAKIQEISSTNLADALGLRELQPAKPVLPVFRALRYGDNNRFAPIGVLAHLIVRDDTLLHRLLEQKRTEIAAAWKRAGSSIQSPVSVERELWSIGYSELSFNKKEIQDLEWGRKTTLSESDVLKEIRGIGEERAREALANLLQQRDYSTVQSTFKNLIYQHGIAPLESKLKTSQRALQNFRDGEEVPSLPRLRSFLERAEVPLTQILELDWREQTARHTALLHHGDLERALTAHIAEHADNRVELLRSQGTRASSIIRHLRWLNDTDLIESKHLKRIAQAFAIDLGSPRGAFISAVAQTGSIPAAIATWMQSSPDPVKVRQTLECIAEKSGSWASSNDSLSSIRAQLGGEGRQPEEFSEALRLLRQLPGVTRGDIVQALNEQTSPLIQLQEQLLRKCEQRKISRGDLVYACAENATALRKPLGLIEKSLKQNLSSSAFPLGVAAVLAGTTIDEVNSNLEQATEAVRLHLQSLSLPATDLAIQMQLWRVRPDDIKGGIKDLQRALWSNDPESIDRIQPQVMAIRQNKIASTINRMLFCRNVAEPADVVAIARETVQGGDRTLVAKAGLSFGAPVRMALGKEVPTFKQISQIFSLIKRKMDRGANVEWLLAYAARDRGQTGTPIARALDVQFALRESLQKRSVGDAPSSDEQTRTLKSTEHRITRSFLQSAGLSPATYLRVLREAASKGVLANDHFETLVGVLGFETTSLDRSFLKHCNGAASMPEAILAWCKQHARHETLSAGLDALVTYITASETRGVTHDTATDRALPMDALIERWVNGPRHANNLPLAALTVARCLAGATRAEVLMAAEKFKQFKLDEKDRSERRAESQDDQRKRAPSSGIKGRLDIPSWTITPQMTKADLETRVSLLAHKMIDGEQVTNTHLSQLFPDLASTMANLARVMGHETPWYVASLVCYKYPDYALERIKKHLRNGEVPKQSGRQHFEAHLQWVRDRGEMGKLNEGSLGLFFEQRFVMPTQLPSAQASPRPKKQA